MSDRIPSGIFFVGLVCILVILFFTFEGVMQVRHDVRELAQRAACVCSDLDGGL